MKLNPSPEGSGSKWNSDEPAFGNLSCSEVSRLGTNVVGIMRILMSDKSRGGFQSSLRSLHQIIGHQIDLMDSPVLSDENKKMVADSARLSILSNCMAGICSDGEVDPRSLAAIIVSIMEGVNKLPAGSVKPDDVVCIDAKISPNEDGEESLVLGIHMEKVGSLASEFNKTEIGRAINSVVRFSGKESTGAN